MPEITAMWLSFAAISFFFGFSAGYYIGRAQRIDADLNDKWSEIAAKLKRPKEPAKRPDDPQEAPLPPKPEHRAPLSVVMRYPTPEQVRDRKQKEAEALYFQDFKKPRDKESL